MPRTSRCTSFAVVPSFGGADGGEIFDAFDVALDGALDLAARFCLRDGGRAVLSASMLTSWRFRGRRGRRLACSRGFLRHVVWCGTTSTPGRVCTIRVRWLSCASITCSRSPMLARSARLGRFIVSRWRLARSANVACAVVVAPVAAPIALAKSSCPIVLVAAVLKLFSQSPSIERQTSAGSFGFSSAMIASL